MRPSMLPRPVPVVTRRDALVLFESAAPDERVFLDIQSARAIVMREAWDRFGNVWATSVTVYDRMEDAGEGLEMWEEVTSYLLQDAVEAELDVKESFPNAVEIDPRAED